MRKLTIKREKSFVGCLAKMKVYIEDSSSGEIVINNVSYRKIGELKNGEERTFLIDGNECNVAVIADKLSKDFCNDIYRIPAGESDVYLSGKNVFNPATGNAFRFNVTTDSNILLNRKKGLRKGIILFCVFLLIGFCVGFLISKSISQNTPENPKSFSNEGMTITLTNKFRQASQAGFTACYGSEDVAVFVLKESFSLLEGLDQYTLKEYGNLVIANNNLSLSLQENSGLTYFEYQFINAETNDPYHYISFIYKATDSFWIVQFAALEKNFKNYKDDIFNWANSITFKS